MFSLPTAIRAVMLLLAAALFHSEVRAETVTDVLGRSVDVRLPVGRVILGEGRQMYVVAMLDRDDPFRRVVGWRDDLPKADPGTYKAYLARNPALATMPAFGGSKEGAFDIEQAIALKPDVMILNIEAKLASDEARLVEKLAAAGIPTVYVDFREKAVRNTEPSLRLMGHMFGRDAVAESFIAFRAEQLARVTDRLAAVPDLIRPRVMIDRAGGYSDDCCMSFGRENFGAMVAMAGGRNIADDVIPATFGVVNPEFIVASDPEVVVVTGGEWNAYVPGGHWVGLGPGADLAEARRRLAALCTRPAFANSAAVKAGRVHGIWHQFYNSPYQFGAVQALAKWLHPELFADLDPDATMKTLSDRFLPLPYRPGYWVDLAAAP